MKTKNLLTRLLNDLSLQTQTNSFSNISFPFLSTEFNTSNTFNTIDEAQELNGLYCHPKRVKADRVNKPDKARKTMLFKKYDISRQISKDQIKTTQSFLNQTSVQNTISNTNNLNSNHTNSILFQTLYPLSPQVSINQLEYKNSLNAMKKLKRNKIICSTINSIFTQCQFESYQQQIKNHNDQYPLRNQIHLPRIIPLLKSSNDRIDDGQTRNRSEGFSRDSYFANSYYYSFTSGFSRNKPSARAQSSLTSILNEDIMYLIGGINSEKLIDVWKCELKMNREIDYKMNWTKKEINEDSALPRMGHSACLHNNKIYIYGGKTNRDIPFAREDILSYNIKTNEMRNESCHNKTCSLWRKNHTANVISNHMVVIGGISDKEEYITEVNVLDLNVFKWRYLSMEKGYHVPPVAYHSSCVIIPFEKLFNNQMGLYRSPDNQRIISIPRIKYEGLYYFGGKNKKGQCINELRVLRLGKKVPDLILLKCYGKPPIPRHSCTITFHEPFDLLMVYGGKNDNNSPSVFNDLFVMNVFDLNWIQINLFGVPAPPRAEHCACIIGKALVIFGGSNNEGYLSSDLFMINLDYFSNRKLFEDYELQVMRMDKAKD